MLKIAYCESGLRHYDTDGEVLQSYYGTLDFGVFQINTRYHLKASQKMGLDIMKLEDNIAYAKHLYKTQGVQPWKASEECWSKLAFNIPVVNTPVDK